MSRALEALAPARLGTNFRWLLAASWATNLGDGIVLAAGPLLVASQTDEEFLIAAAALVQWLPKLLFGLLAGALADRLDRRALAIVVDLLRVVVLAFLVVTLIGGAASIGVALVALFLLGTAETFADNVASTMLPMFVGRDDVALGNARLQTGFITLNQLAGPPIGAALFVAGQAWPFAAQTAIGLLAALLLSRMVLSRREHAAAARPQIHHDIGEGLRWVVRHPAVRTLVLTIFTFNITFGAAWSVLISYATKRLGLAEFGFGLITTVVAAGGLAGTLAYGWITRHVSLGDVMRIGLIIETLTHLALAVTTTAWIAMVVFFVFGAHAFVWGTTSITVRQRAVPSPLQGRVNSVNSIGTFGGLVAGSAVGGLIAQRFGVTGPFWFAFVGSAVFVVLIWRQLTYVAHADQSPPDLSTPASGIEHGRAEPR